MKSLGRLRAEMDHSWRSVKRGYPSRATVRPAQGLRALPLAVRVYLVQSATGQMEKLQVSRVRVRGRNALYGGRGTPAQPGFGTICIILARDNGGLKHQMG